MNILSLLSYISDMVWALPILILFFLVCVYFTLQLGFVQIHYFFESIRLVFKPAKNTTSSSSSISPFQAFMNTLGGNIGNGSLSGIPTAIVAGGPGALFWLLLMSTFAISLRFAEVFLSSYFADKATVEKSGPMYYLSLLPAGKFLAKLFAVFGFAFMVIGGNMIQCNAVGTALMRAFDIPSMTTAIIIALLVGYICIGGSERIVKFLDTLVPVKVFGFLATAIVVVFYHWQSIPQAFALMYHSAFNSQAILGGSFAYALQQTIKWGFAVGSNAGESGLGTAAVAFGMSKGQDPVKNGIMSMLSVYINTHIVCLLVGLIVLVTGVWDQGEMGTALLISAYQTVYGSIAGWIISILVAIFATSAVVAFAFIAKSCWDSLVSVKYRPLFAPLYTLCALVGTTMSVVNLIGVCGIAAAGLFWINVLALLWFLPIIKKNLFAYNK